MSTNHTRTGSPPSAESRLGWTALIKAAASTPLGLLALIVLVSEAMLGVALPVTPAASRTSIVITMIALMALVVIAATVMVFLRASDKERQPKRRENPIPQELADQKKLLLIAENMKTVIGADAPQPSLDEWADELQQLRPVLSQVTRYSMPTYYLDTSLNIIDFNVAFELIFRPILPRIRNRHVNHFIAELANCEQVFDHARDFSEKSRRGELPLVDMEPLVFESEAYGRVEFEKVACQLTDPEANLKAWAVGLMIKQIDWEQFAADLLPRLKDDKLWSIYAASYDAILLEFPPYAELIEEVLKGIGRDARSVLDLGAGTGNVSAALLKRGCRVTAVENNHPMLEKFFSKHLDRNGKLTVNKNSVDDLRSFKDESFDAVVAVNVLYAVEDPVACIRNVARVLKPGGVFAFSTTHAEIQLEPLLMAIRKQLEAEGKFEAREEHYRRVYEINKNIELTLAKRHTKEVYENWVRESGLEIFYSNPLSYCGAVMVVHARKR